MSLKDLLAELQKEYLATFPEKTAAIERYWRESKFEDLESEFHKIKGTGRTYGLPEVSLLGELMEKLCQVRTGETSANSQAVARDQLKTAIPLATAILERIRQGRTQGVPLKLDDDPDYQAISSLLPPASK
jgi:HPt (histidine-containing phosphotransfer) domain-containing protein